MTQCPSSHQNTFSSSFLFDVFESADFSGFLLQECHQALQNTLQIISALHDVVYYLVSFARLGNPNTSFSPSSTQRLTADWGGLESIGI